MLWPFYKRLGPNQPLKQTKELYNMNRNTLFSFLTVAALGLVMAGPADAACTFTWTGDGDAGDFRDPDNWDSSGAGCSDYPTAGDKVIIPDVNTHDPVIDDQDEQFSELDINSGGLLTITGKKLTLDGTTTHDIRGDLVLSENTPVSVLKFSASVTVAGAGQIKGEDNAAELQIVGDKTLTSTLDIVGRMKIKGLVGGANPATFVNGASGVVRADAAGTLLLAAGLTLQDDGATCSTAIWEASGNSSAILKFAQSATGLTSLFRLDDCAVIEIAASVDINTVNTLKDKAGTATAEGYVKVGSSGSFIYRDSCPSGDQNTLTASCTLIGSECDACP